jgi:hypothetical protein
MFGVHDKTFEKPLLVRVYDKTREVGCVHVYLHEDNVDKGKHRDDWFDLLTKDDSGNDKRVGASVRLLLEYNAQRSRAIEQSQIVEKHAVNNVQASVHRTRERIEEAGKAAEYKEDFVPATQEHVRQANKRRTELFEKVKGMFHDDYNFYLRSGKENDVTSADSCPKGMGLLRVAVLAGKDLPVMNTDGGVFKSQGLSDPYVKVFYREDELDQTRDLYLGQTNTEYLTLNPVFGRNSNVSKRYDVIKTQYQSADDYKIFIKPWTDPPRSNAVLQPVISTKVGKKNLPSHVAKTEAELTKNWREEHLKYGYKNTFCTHVHQPRQKTSSGATGAELPWSESKDVLIFQVWDNEDDKIGRGGAQHPKFIGQSQMKLSECVTQQEGTIEKGEWLPIHLSKKVKGKGNNTAVATMARTNPDAGTPADTADFRGELLVHVQVDTFRNSITGRGVDADEAERRRLEDVELHNREKLMIFLPREQQDEQWRQRREAEWRSAAMEKIVDTADASPYRIKMTQLDDGLRPWYMECDQVVDKIKHVKGQYLSDIDKLKHMYRDEQKVAKNTLRRVDAGFHNDYFLWCKSRKVATVSVNIVEALDLELPYTKMPAATSRQQLAAVTSKSEPYVKIVTKGPDGVQSERHRTLHRKSERNPKWNEEFVVDVMRFSRVSTPSKIILQVWDHDEQFGHDEFLGQCEVDLEHVKRGIWLPKESRYPEHHNCTLPGNAEQPKCVKTGRIPGDENYNSTDVAKFGLGSFRIDEHMTDEERDQRAREEKFRQATDDERLLERSGSLRDRDGMGSPGGERGQAGGAAGDSAMAYDGGTGIALQATQVRHVPSYAKDPWENEQKLKYNLSQAVKIQRQGEGQLLMQGGVQNVRPKNKDDFAQIVSRISKWHSQIVNVDDLYNQYNKRMVTNEFSDDEGDIELIIPKSKERDELLNIAGVSDDDKVQIRVGTPDPAIELRVEGKQFVQVEKVVIFETSRRQEVRLRLKHPWKTEWVPAQSKVGDGITGDGRAVYSYNYKVVDVLPPNELMIADKLPTGRHGELEMIKCLQEPEEAYEYHTTATTGIVERKGLGRRYLFGVGRGAYNEEYPEETSVDGWYNLRPSNPKMGNGNVLPMVRGFVRVHCKYTPYYEETYTREEFDRQRLIEQEAMSSKSKGRGGRDIGGGSLDEYIDEEDNTLRHNLEVRQRYKEEVPSIITRQQFWTLHRVRVIRDALVAEYLKLLQTKEAVTLDQRQVFARLQDIFLDESTMERFVVQEKDENGNSVRDNDWKARCLGELMVRVLSGRELLPMTSDKVQRLFQARFARVKIVGGAARGTKDGEAGSEPRGTNWAYDTPLIGDAEKPPKIRAVGEQPINSVQQRINAAPELQYATSDQDPSEIENPATFHHRLIDPEKGEHAVPSFYVFDEANLVRIEVFDRTLKLEEVSVDEKMTVSVNQGMVRGSANHFTSRQYATRTKYVSEDVCIGVVTMSVGELLQCRTVNVPHLVEREGDWKEVVPHQWFNLGQDISRSVMSTMQLDHHNLKRKPQGSIKLQIYFKKLPQILMDQRLTSQREQRLVREAKSLKYDLMLKMRENHYTYRRFFDEFKDSTGAITAAQLEHVIYTTFHLLGEHDERQRHEIVERLMRLFQRPRTDIQDRIPPAARERIHQWIEPYPSLNRSNGKEEYEEYRLVDLPNTAAIDFEHFVAGLGGHPEHAKQELGDMSQAVNFLDIKKQRKLVADLSREQITHRLELLERRNRPDEELATDKTKLTMDAIMTRDALIDMMAPHAAFARKIKNIFHQDYVELLKKEEQMSNTVHSQGSVSGDAKLLRASHRSATMTVQIERAENFRLPGVDDVHTQHLYPNKPQLDLIRQKKEAENAISRLSSTADAKYNAGSRREVKAASGLTVSGDSSTSGDPAAAQAQLAELQRKLYQRVHRRIRGNSQVVAFGNDEGCSPASTLLHPYVRVRPKAACKNVSKVAAVARADRDDAMDVEMEKVKSVTSKNVYLNIKEPDVFGGTIDATQSYRNANGGHEQEPQRVHEVTWGPEEVFQFDVADVRLANLDLQIMNNVPDSAVGDGAGTDQGQSGGVIGFGRSRGDDTANDDSEKYVHQSKFGNMATDKRKEDIYLGNVRLHVQDLHDMLLEEQEAVEAMQQANTRDQEGADEHANELCMRRCSRLLASEDTPVLKAGDVSLKFVTTIGADKQEVNAMDKLGGDVGQWERLSDIVSQQLSLKTRVAKALSAHIGNKTARNSRREISAVEVEKLEVHVHSHSQSPCLRIEAHVKLPRALAQGFNVAQVELGLQGGTSPEGILGWETAMSNTELRTAVSKAFFRPATSKHYDASTLVGQLVQPDGYSKDERSPRAGSAQEQSLEDVINLALGDAIAENDGEVGKRMFDTTARKHLEEFTRVFFKHESLSPGFIGLAAERGDLERRWGLRDRIPVAPLFDQGRGASSTSAAGPSRVQRCGYFPLAKKERKLLDHGLDQVERFGGNYDSIAARGGMGGAARTIIVHRWYPFEPTKEAQGQSAGRLKLKIKLTLREHVEPYDTSEFVPHHDLIRMLKKVKHAFDIKESGLLMAARERNKSLVEMQWLQRCLAVRLRNQAREKVIVMKLNWLKAKENGKHEKLKKQQRKDLASKVMVIGVILRLAFLHRDPVSGLLPPRTFVAEYGLFVSLSCRRSAILRAWSGIMSPSGGMSRLASGSRSRCS